jgi:cytochrome P450
MTIELITPTTFREPPTAPGLPLIGNAITFMTSNGLPVPFMKEAAAKYGDLVRLSVGKQNMYLASHPDLVHEVLVKRVNEFHKPGKASEKPLGLSRFLGDSILTADHDEWRPQRKLIQPLMHTKQIANYAETMGRFGQKLLDLWQNGAERDIHADMMQVTMWIIAETMFGMDVTQTPTLAAAADDAQAITVADLKSPLPAWMTHGRDRQADEINTILTDLVNHFMAERRAYQGSERHDLLSLLMDTRDEEGRPMSDEFVRNNILTLFFAGHETTANTLTWAFYYLDKNPEVAAKLQDEVDTVLNGRVPTLDDLPNLPYTLMVIKETMRLEPTVAIFPRYVPEDTALGEYQIKGDSIVLLPPYVLHHDPRWWSQPDQYDPTRFSAENEPNIPKYAYLPFGGGPRICIGNHFALMEAHILLALLVSHYRLHLASEKHIEPVRQVTTSPEGGLHMRLEKRHI